MNQEKNTIIAVDVAKENLMVFHKNRTWKIPNDEEGFKALRKQIADPARALIVCEATGGYERKLTRWMRQRSVGVHVANPSRVRSYAKGKGIRLKSDPVDARLLHSYAIDNQVEACRTPTAVQEELSALLDRRSHLSRELTREKNRREKEPAHIADLIAKSIEFIEAQIAEIDSRLEEVARQDETIAQRRDQLASIKGVGTLTAITVLTYLPELDQVSRNRAVALAGLAPFDFETGNYSGRRFIQGGRAKIRRCLYMAAVSAMRFNPIIRDYVNGLIARGKPFKCAAVAAMRKILICMQRLLKDPDFQLQTESKNVPITA